MASGSLGNHSGGLIVPPGVILPAVLAGNVATEELSGLVLSDVQDHFARNRAMFADSGSAILQRHFGGEPPDHPIAERNYWLHHLCDDLTVGRLPYQKESLDALAHMYFDKSVWSTKGWGDEFWQILIEPRHQSHMRRRLARGCDCLGAAQEVFWWGWLNRWYPTTFVAAEGSPDLRVGVDHEPLWAEVKTIFSHDNDERLHHAIKKANRQIRNVTRQLGMVMIHINQPHDNTLTGDIPQDIVNDLLLLQRMLARPRFSYVGQVTLTWDESSTRQEPNNGKSYTFARRAVTLTRNHVCLNKALADALQNFSMALTATWRDDGITLDSMTLTDSCGNMNIDAQQTPHLPASQINLSPRSDDPVSMIA